MRNRNRFWQFFFFNYYYLSMYQSALASRNKKTVRKFTKEIDRLNTIHKLVSLKRDSLRVCFKTTTVFLFFFLALRLCCAWSILIFYWRNLNLAISLRGVIHWHWEVMGHFSKCFMVSGVVYTGLIWFQMQLLSTIFLPFRSLKLFLVDKYPFS